MAEARKHGEVTGLQCQNSGILEIPEEDQHIDTAGNTWVKAEDGKWALILPDGSFRKTDVAQVEIIDQGK